MFLWEFDISSDDTKKYDDIIKKSLHRVSDRRIKHLANWVNKSYSPETSFTFISENIDAIEFFPFASPWEINELENIYKKTNGSKLIRLSTREAGVLTISSNIIINCHRRFYIGREGINFGNFKFKNIEELSAHMDKNECCVCLEDIIKYNNTTLKCGHILHNVCLSNHSDNSNCCPVCKKNISNSIVLPHGNICNYSQLTVL